MKTLIYFIENTNIPFVKKDIKLLSEEFENIYLFSTENIGNANELPSKAKIIESYVDWSGFSVLKYFLSHPFLVIGTWLNEMFACGKYQPLKQSIAVLCSNFYKAEECLKAANKENISLKESLFYSFWFYDCIFLARLKQAGNIAHAVTRAHGGDLYEERSSLSGKPLFRQYQFRFLDRVYPISNHGRGYLKSLYPKYSDKIFTSYLGSSEFNALNTCDPDRFVIVSCSKNSYNKRIYLIAEALTKIDFPIEWHHFGDENLNAKKDDTIPLYKKYKEVLKGKENVKFFTPGHTDNSKILDFYRNNPVNLFVSLSASEGIPVSIMEATSFGIPVLSTDVGGCSEIVNDTTGILVDKDITADEVSRLLEEFRGSEKNKQAYRNTVKDFWKANFEETKNYKEFISSIQTLND